MRAQQMTALVWVAIVFLTHGHSEEAMRLLPQPFGSESGLRGLSVVSGEVAWVSGTGGTVSRTTDGGETWQVQVVPGAEKLDFRDVEAFGASVAYLLAAGPGDASRVYKTTDGGKTWRQQAVNADAQGFWDAMAFWDERNGIVFGDPVDGQFRLLITEDGGETWRPLAPTGMPRALPREGAFAASGTCLVTGGTRDVWFATGGAGVGRVFHSGDRGRTWTVVETPVAGRNESSGIFSIGLRGGVPGVVVGGDYRKPQDAVGTIAHSGNGGRDWKLAKTPAPFCSAVAWAKDRWIAVGTAGIHASQDGGETWKPLDGGNYNAVQFAANGTGWAVGPKGRVVRMNLEPR